MARKSGFVRRDGRMRRQMLWFDADVISTTLAAASSVALIAQLNAAALALRPFTVVRTRGTLFAKSDQTAANENFQVLYGHIVVQDVAAGVGVGSVPTPEAENASDFYVMETLMGSFGFVTGVGLVNNGVSREFDSKAMRKVDLGETVVQTVEASGVSNGVQIISIARSLIKLH